MKIFSALTLNDVIQMVKDGVWYIIDAAFGVICSTTIIYSFQRQLNLPII